MLSSSYQNSILHMFTVFKHFFKFNSGTNWFKTAVFIFFRQNYDAMIVRSATKVTERIIKAGSRLKLIGRAGTGVDNIDCAAATKKGVIVMK